MATSTCNTQPATPPVEIVTAREWEQIDCIDRRDAINLYAALAAIELYPARDLAGEYPRQVIENRAALHNLIDRISDDNNLAAALYVVRLLALTERPAQMFDIFEHFKKHKPVN